MAHLFTLLKGDHTMNLNIIAKYTKFHNLTKVQTKTFLIPIKKTIMSICAMLIVIYDIFNDNV